MKINGLGYVGVESPQHAVWNELAPTVFAAQISEVGDDGTIYIKIDDRHHRIAVHPGPRNRLAYLGWEVDDDEAFRAAIDDLKAARVQFTSATADECVTRKVTEMVHFRDPAGHRFEIFHGQLEHYRSFTPARQHAGFVTGPQGMGHVVVAVPDILAEDALLRNVMGLRMTDHLTGPTGKTRFYHANARHHSIALLEIPETHGLHHIMMQVNDIDDVGIAHDVALERKDLSMQLTLGRHSTDRMVSFYVRTPSGFEIEYGWGGKELDVETWVATQSPFPAETWGHKYVGDGTPPSTFMPTKAEVAIA